MEEAFPKDDLPIKRGGEDFQSLPLSLQWRYVSERFLERVLSPTENKQDMITKYGSFERLVSYVRERERQRFLAKYGCGDLDWEEQWEKYGDIPMWKRLGGKK